MDGAADRFEGWDVVVGDLDSIANPEGIKKDENQQNSDLAKALIEYEVDAIVGVEGGRLDHRLAAFTALFESNQMQFYILMDGEHVELRIQVWKSNCKKELFAR